MTNFIAAITLVVPNYDDAIAFYVGKLGFELLEDTALSATKRWVRVAPVGAQTAFIIAKADGPAQELAVGNQTGGRVSFFLQTDDFEGDFARFMKNGVEFLEEPRHEVYGSVVVFADPFGNKWDLIEPK